MRQLLIRLDDIAPAMDWDRFERLAALFEQYHIRPIIGVVPDCRDRTLCVQEEREDFWERMRSLQEAGWTIAQHGFQHVYVTKKAGLLGVNPFSEFAGLSYREQLDKLRRGQEILHKQGICATMFMAPGHTFDRRTLKALKGLGFTSVTDGYCGRPYRRKGLVFLPCTLSEPRVPGNFDTLCIHANHMTENEFDELACFIGRHQELIGDAREYVQAVPRCREIAPYSPVVWLEEKRNLFLRRVKRFAAHNGTVQAYLQRTDDDRPAVKKRKRILGIPGLAMRLLFHRGSRN